MFGRKDKWPDSAGTEKRSEYDRNRRIAEGEGAGATKAAWVLGGTVLILGGLLTMEKLDNRAIEKLEQLQFVVVEKARDGEILSSTIASGQLQADTSIEQWLLADWLDKWRGVPLDPVAFNRDYFKAQQFMCSAVQARIDKTMQPDPDDPKKLTPKKMMELGITRRVHVTNITPRGGESNSYRLDWTETLYRNSQAIQQAKLTADAELRYFTPETGTDAAKNPYGMYICGFDSALAPTS